MNCNHNFIIVDRHIIKNGYIDYSVCKDCYKVLNIVENEKGYMKKLCLVTD